MGNKSHQPVLSFNTCRNSLVDDDYNDIAAKFMALTKRENTGGKLKKEEFVEGVLREQFGGLGAAAVDRIYRVVDTSGGGGISFTEFLCAMFLFWHADRGYKQMFVFNLFDLDASGRVSKKEFLHFQTMLMKQRRGDDGKCVSAAEALRLEEGKSKADDKADAKLDKDLGNLVKLFGVLALRAFDRDGDAMLEFDEWQCMADEDELINEAIDMMARPKRKKVGGGGAKGAEEAKEAAAAEEQEQEQGEAKAKAS